MNSMCDHQNKIETKDFKDNFVINTLTPYT